MDAKALPFGPHNINSFFWEVEPEVFFFLWARRSMILSWSYNFCSILTIVCMLPFFGEQMRSAKEKELCCLLLVRVVGTWRSHFERNVESKYIQKRPHFFFFLFLFLSYWLGPKNGSWNQISHPPSERMQRLYHLGPTISILSSRKWS